MQVRVLELPLATQGRSWLWQVFLVLVLVVFREVLGGLVATALVKLEEVDDDTGNLVAKLLQGAKHGVLIHDVDVPVPHVDQGSQIRLDAQSLVECSQPAKLERVW